MKKFAFIFLISTFLPLTALASDCSGDGYTVVYVNGILTTRAQADDDRVTFSNKFSERTNLKNIQFITGYNPTHLGGADDFLNSITQIYTQGKWIDIEGSDFDTILRQIQPEIATRKILLVGHSQGTFYTNAMYQYLLAHGATQGSVAVYNLGTPADFVGGNGKYLTSSGDELVAAVRALAKKYHAPEPLPANIDILPQQEAAGAYVGHSFVADYLNGAPDRIVSDIQTELGWLTVRGKSAALEGCFDAPPYTAVDISAGGFFLIGDPLIDTGVAAAKSGAHIAVQFGKDAIAMVETTRAAIGTVEHKMADALTTIAAGLWDTVNLAIATHSQATVIAGANLSDLELHEAAAAAFPVADSNGMATVVQSTSTPITSSKKLEAMSSTTSTLSTEGVATSTPALLLATSTQSAATSSRIAEAPVIHPALLSPGFGGGAPAPAPTVSTKSDSPATSTASSTPPKDLEDVATSTEAQATSTPQARSTPLAAPMLTIAQCTQSFSAVGNPCLIATTSVALQWNEIAGAVAYEVLEDGAPVASTTATATTLTLPQNGSTSITVRALNAAGDASTSLLYEVENNAQPAVLNEIGWAGTDASSSDQWIELRNKTDTAIDLSKFTLGAGALLSLSGTLPADGFAVLYRANPIGGIGAPQFQVPFMLDPQGMQLQLILDGAVIDETPDPGACGGWCGGEAKDPDDPATDAISMERSTGGEGSDPSLWQDNDGVTMDGTDADGNPIFGTPGAENSAPVAGGGTGSGPSLQ